MGSYSFKIRLFLFLFLHIYVQDMIITSVRQSLDTVSPSRQASRVSFPFIIRQLALAAVTGVYP